MLQFFDHARKLPNLVFEPAQTRDKFGVVASALWLAEELSKLNVCWRESADLRGTRLQRNGSRRHAPRSGKRRDRHK